jgi:hypothetical protein
MTPADFLANIFSFVLVVAIVGICAMIVWTFGAMFYRMFDAIMRALESAFVPRGGKHSRRPGAPRERATVVEDTSTRWERVNPGTGEVKTFVWRGTPK